MLAPALRELVDVLAPNIPPPVVVTLGNRVVEATLPQRIVFYALGVMGVLALAIAAIGLYGVISCVVVCRTHEFGVRTALGAASSDVLRIVIHQGLAVMGLVGLAACSVPALRAARVDPLVAIRKDG